MRVCDIKDGGPQVASARLGGPLPLPLFLETPLPPQAELPALNSKHTLLLFLKLYDPASQALRVRRARARRCTTGLLAMHSCCSALAASLLALLCKDIPAAFHLRDSKPFSKDCGTSLSF